MTGLPSAFQICPLTSSMARASTLPAPPQAPFWHLPAFRWGVIAMGAILLIAGAFWLEKMNRSYQLERRLEEDTRLGPMARTLKQQIGQAERSGILKDAVQAAQAQAPQALWLGRISEVKETENRDGGILEISDAHLLAGRSGPHDLGGRVRVGRRKFVYGSSRPRVGETWLISVWRDGSGNAIHSAARYAAVP